MTTAQQLGNNLYQLRKQASLSQEELAERLGVSRQAVSKWECGETMPDTENLIAISRIFGVSLDALVGNAPTDTQGDDATQPDFTVEIVTDEDDEEGGSLYDEPEDAKRGVFMRILSVLPYPILVTIAFLFWGFQANGWTVAWTLFITIPIYYSFLECIRQKRFTPFAYPVLMAFLYVLIGSLYNIWHPTWLMFVTVPLYYPIAAAIDRKIQ